MVSRPPLLPTVNKQMINAFDQDPFGTPARIYLLEVTPLPDIEEHCQGDALRQGNKDATIADTPFPKNSYSLFFVYEYKVADENCTTMRTETCLFPRSWVWTRDVTLRRQPASLSSKLIWTRPLHTSVAHMFFC